MRHHPKKNTAAMAAVYGVALLSLLFGIVLLVAGKSFAGPVFILTPWVALVPLGRFGASVTGLKLVDQLATIFTRFTHIVFGG